ncbi:pyridoxamine 5'-phosphate oxidase family protein [Terrabacter sp. 2RAF25]|uniref:pyridoxamine 5'-phosphate oxidase family protein n=1 Tax=Terrabacter sp. 2RAF25 TaxID=3232998 RepID=UPI003F943EEC
MTQHQVAQGRGEFPARRSSRRQASSDLSPADCQALLESRSIGRIGWSAGDGPQIFPISYACVADLIVFRTSPFGVLSELVRPAQVVFEVDELDERAHSGWSVIARGRAQAVASPALLTHLWTLDGAEPWAAGTRNLFIGIEVARLSGRSFGAHRAPSTGR